MCDPANLIGPNHKIVLSAALHNGRAAPGEESMNILVVTFELNGLSADAYAAACTERAPRFAALPGLISKIWLADPATNTYGGVYLWQNRAALEAYLASETFRAMRANSYFANIAVRAFDTLPEATALTAGPVASS
jgi:hypothetical protein